MWAIEKIGREPLDVTVASWERVKEFPEWNDYEDESAALAYFVIMFNTDQLSSNYYYRVVWV
jgi:hypothetical protein